MGMITECGAWDKGPSAATVGIESFFCLLAVLSEHRGQGPHAQANSADGCSSELPGLPGGPRRPREGEEEREFHEREYGSSTGTRANRCSDSNGVGAGDEETKDRSRETIDTQGATQEKGGKKCLVLE